jgi:NAD(P)-dependent dehydrogenase (short-subunit alcohol dehydrogenase family)
MDLKLTGKVALITGSSRGIGLATAKAFAAEGCRLMLSARSAEQLAEAEAGLRTNGAEIAAHVAAVSNPDEQQGWFKPPSRPMAASTPWSTTWAVAEEALASPTAPMMIGAMPWKGTWFRPFE